MTAFLPYAMSALSAVLLVCVFRIWRGPTLADRVVALDLASTTAVALLGVYSVFTNSVALLDAAITVALVSFLGVVAIAHYMNRGGEE